MDHFLNCEEGNPEVFLYYLFFPHDHAEVLMMKHLSDFSCRDLSAIIADMKITPCPADVSNIVHIPPTM